MAYARVLVKVISFGKKLWLDKCDKCDTDKYLK